MTTQATGAYRDDLPLANITIAGIRGQPNSLTLSVNGQQQPTDDVKFNYTDCGALYITNLDKATQGGVWNGNVTVTLNYGHGHGWA